MPHIKDRLRVWLPALRVGSGSDVFVERLASALERAGHEPVVTWYSRQFEFAPVLLGPKAAPSGIDVVHANAAQAFAFKRPGVPLVATELHYILDPAFRPFKSGLQDVYHRYVIGPNLRRSFQRANSITAISRFTAGAISAAPGVSLPVRVTPLWVDLDLFSPADPAGGHAGQPFRLFFVGNASSRKGADVMARLADRLGPAFEVHCTSGLREVAASSLPSNVVVLGRLDEAGLVQEYRNCDAALVPSRYEGFGYSALEAMACARPVVGFSSGAISELVVDGESGLLAEVGDIDGLESHCRRLAGDAALCRRLGNAGRLRAESAYSETVGVEGFVSAYRDAIRDHVEN